MNDENEEIKARIRRLQARINDALRESPDARAATRFTPYRFDDVEPDIAKQLLEAVSRGGLDGMETMMDKLEEIALYEDKGRLRYELMLLLTHYPEAARLGLRIPSIEERSAWKVIPSNDESEGA